MSKDNLSITTFSNLQSFAQKHDDYVAKYLTSKIIVDCVLFIQGESKKIIVCDKYIDTSKENIVIIVAPQSKVVLYDAYALQNNKKRTTTIVALKDSECYVLHHDCSDQTVDGSLLINYRAFSGLIDSRLYGCSAKVLKQEIILDLFEGSNIEMSVGAIVGSDKKYLIFAQQNHHHPKTMSNFVVKRVVKESSIVGYSGHVFVAQGAQDALVDQKDATLIAGQNVQIFSQPTLEALHNDISCFHGSSIGTFSEQELFYMKSRGIAPLDAKQMLEQGFIANLFSCSPFAAFIQQFFTKTTITIDND